MKPNHSSLKNWFLCFERTDFHFIYDVFLSLLSKLTDNCIFLERPFYKVFKGYFINVFAHSFVQSISSQYQANHILISLNSILPHCIVIEWLLAKRVAFCQFALELSCLVDWSISFFDIVKSWAWVSLLNDNLPFVKLLPNQRRSNGVLLMRCQSWKEANTFKTFFVLSIIPNYDFLNCLAKSNSIDGPEFGLLKSNNLAIPFRIVQKCQFSKS